jgi:MFS family permease
MAETSAAHPPRFLQVLRHRGFRLFWLGLISQVLGQMMFQFTLGWLAFELTRSPASLALVHLCGFAPQIAVTLLGGVLADRWDQRKLIGIAQSLGAVTMVTLGVVALQGLAELWHLALASFLLGVSTSLDEPSRSAFFPRLLPDRTQLRTAIPLISMAWGGTRVIAPSIGGFLIAASGAHTSFLVSAIGVGVMLVVVCIVRPLTPSAPSHGSMLKNFVESVRYVRGKEVFSKVIVAVLLNASFAMGYVHMLPVFAKVVLEVDARGLGILSAAPGVGAFTGLLTYAMLQARFTPRNVMVFALAAFNLLLIGFALSERFWLSLLLGALAGLAQSYFMTSTQVILQTLVDDQYRGRVMALFSLVWSFMVFSGFLLNFTAEFMGPQLALIGGSAVVLIYVRFSLAPSLALRKVSLVPRPS